MTGPMRVKPMHAALRVGCIVLASLHLPSMALAAPGESLTLGGFAVAPSLNSAFEYRSNAYLSDGVINEVRPALAFVFRPEVQLQRESSTDVMSVRGAWNMRKFIDVEPEDGTNTANLDRWRDMDLDVAVDLRKESRVGVRLDDHFEVISTPAQLESATRDTDANIRLTSNDVRGGLVVRPGSAFEVGLLGNLGLDRYDVPEVLAETGNPNLNNRQSYGPVLDVRWKFLPRTSVVLRGTMNWLDWENNLVNAVGPDVAAAGAPYGTFIGKPDATKWHVATGLRGQVTERFALVSELGFGQMTYDETSVSASGNAAASGEAGAAGEESFARDLSGFGEGFTANLLLRYGFGGVLGDNPRHALSVGYKRDFQDAFFTNYVVFNSVSARYTGHLGSRLTVDSEASARLDDYYGEVSRTDLVLRARAGANWRPAPESRLGLALGLGWNERACGDADCESGGFYGVQYDDFYGNLGATYGF